MATFVQTLYIVTFHVSHRWRERYCGRIFFFLCYISITVSCYCC